MGILLEQQLLVVVNLFFFLETLVVLYGRAATLDVRFLEGVRISSDAVPRCPMRVVPLSSHRVLGVVRIKRRALVPLNLTSRT